MASTLRLRESARGLIVDEDWNCLLVHFDFHQEDTPGGFWAVPGGGVEAGESHEGALRRELIEETGIELGAMGPKVCVKTAIFTMTHHDGQVDHIYLVQVPHQEPSPALTREQLADESVYGVKWWAADDVLSGAAVFGPRRLPELLRTVIDTRADAIPVMEYTGF